MEDLLILIAFASVICVAIMLIVIACVVSTVKYALRIYVMLKHPKSMGAWGETEQCIMRRENSMADEPVNASLVITKAIVRK